jgi:DNA-binding response OmpR family regulator
MPMENPRILIVDDEPNIRKILERTLARAGWSADTAEDGQEAITKLTLEAYDLILLDLYMEPVDGLTVLEKIKQVDPETVVIILTAHGSLDSAVEALRLGAYDYVFKPASPDLIQARVKEGLIQRNTALQRRQLMSQLEALKNMLADLDEGELGQTAASPKERFLRSRDLVIDRAHRTAILGEKLLDLTTTEFDALVLLVENSPQPVSPSLLVHYALGYEAEEKEAGDIIKWHIHQLRSKIEPTPTKPKYILTVRYKGYLWAGE